MVPSGGFLPGVCGRSVFAAQSSALRGTLKMWGAKGVAYGSKTAKGEFRMNIKRAPVSGAVASLVDLVEVVPAAATETEPSPTNPVLVSATVVPMVITGFDPQVAIDNGYEVVYDEAGTPRLADSSLIGGATLSGGTV